MNFGNDISCCLHLQGVGWTRFYAYIGYHFERSHGRVGGWGLVPCSSQQRQWIGKALQERPTIIFSHWPVDFSKHKYVYIHRNSATSHTLKMEAVIYV
jgi:hypothetical protein